MSELLADEAFEPEVTSSDVVFEGAVWNIRRDAFDYDGSTIVREYVAHTGAVAILAVDDEGRVLVIRQYRHPIRSREWELPPVCSTSTASPSWPRLSASSRRRPTSWRPTGASS